MTPDGSDGRGAGRPSSWPPPTSSASSCSAAYLLPAGFEPGETDPTESLAFLIDHQAVFYAWYFVLYLVGGASLVALALALGDRLKHREPMLAKASVALGTIWSGLLLASGMIALVGQRAVVELHGTDPDRAATVWAGVRIIQDATGGGIELIGGLWVAAVCWAALRSDLLGRAWVRLGLIAGVAGVMTSIPVVDEPAAAIFGLGMIAWFAGVGRQLLRSR